MVQVRENGGLNPVRANGEEKDVTFVIAGFRIW